MSNTSTMSDGSEYEVRLDAACKRVNQGSLAADPEWRAKLRDAVDEQLRDAGIPELIAERDALAEVIETHQEAAAMKAALDKSERERDEALGLLREWFEHDAEPHFHGLAEDDPGGAFCNECGGELPCFTLRAESLFGERAAASWETTA